MIELKNVSKIYNKNDIEKKALSDINITLPDCGFVFVLGPSGCGKTTLLNIIGGMDNATSGEVLINGEDLYKKSENKINRYRNSNIGFVFQSSNMVPNLNLIDNVILPLKITGISNNKAKEKARKLLKDLGVNDYKKKPNQISGGQKQRVAIARSLINDPNIILADEPTGALDSENAKIVMDILKEISKTKLVIMVTHNESLASIYSDFTINLKDGEIVGIEKNELIEKPIEHVDKGFKSFSIMASTKLAFKSLLNKKIRTIFTLLALTISVISACIVLLVSNSMGNYSDYAQKQALGTYPITISSTVTDDEIENDSNVYPEYPSNNIINIVSNYDSYYSHINTFSNEYLDYVKQMPTELYSVIDYGNRLNMNILSLTKDGYSYISSSSYIKLANSDTDYIESEYDLLYGESIPKSMNELALVIDKNNCIDAYVLDYIGIDYSDISSYTFEEICNKEFKVITNNQLYQKNSETGLYYTVSDKEKLYQESEITLKITAIIRPKKNATMKLYQTGILYTQKLFDYMHEDAKNSNVVIDQLSFGIEKNVFTGKAYADVISDFQTVTKEYLYESNLVTLGYYYRTSYIKIYTDKFENRAKINEYLQEYNVDKEIDNQIIYRDYMGSITEEFNKFIQILTNVFVLFSLISFLISSIMIGLLMYVSVIERIKEIGLLRSFGYSKINVAMLFTNEAGFIGFISSILGVVLAMVFVKPILRFVAGVVEENYSSSFDLSEITKVSMNPFEAILFVLGATLIAIIASIIPAIVAAKKEPVKAINYNAG